MLGLRMADNSALDAPAFYGIAGVFVKAFEKHTEADPYALLVQFLAGFGNAAGGSMHMIIDGARHPLILFVVLAGQTAKGRKGTAEKRVRSVLERADPEWARNCIVGGIVSGEGLIFHLRDFDPIRPADPGIADKRLQVVESEFSGVLKVAERPSNTASEILRQAWDGNTLRTLARNAPLKASSPHLSVIGHITQDELRRTLTSTAQANGFANRFCWFNVHRAHLMPFPSDPDEKVLGTIVDSVTQALDGARRSGQITFSDEARDLWTAKYPELSVERPGLLGAITSRGEAQVMRIAAVYAALDSTSEIVPAHLNAAIDLWNYSVESVETIFGDSIGDPDSDRILLALRAEPNGLSKTEISVLFGRNFPSDRIDRALATLHAGGFARFQYEKRGAGRPVEKWHGVKKAA
jgi:hypothetical protein